MKKNILSVLLVVTVILSGCKDDLEEGVDSLRGDWEVTAIQSIYETTQADGSRETFSVSEDGNLGQFVFTDDTVTFWFTRNDTTYEGKEHWRLRRERENQGFFKVNRFTLEIENSFTFDCTFEDDTKNAQRNANDITLRNETENDGASIWFEISLTKE